MSESFIKSRTRIRVINLDDRPPKTAEQIDADWQREGYQDFTDDELISRYKKNTSTYHVRGITYHCTKYRPHLIDKLNVIELLKGTQ